MLKKLIVCNTTKKLLNKQNIKKRAQSHIKFKLSEKINFVHIFQIIVTNSISTQNP